MPGLFITATGTDVGKTFVTLGLIHAARAAGEQVSALKPVVSGFDELDPKGSDPTLLLAALGRPTTLAELDLVSPWRFKAPLSPDMAARKEGRAIDFEKLVVYCRTASAASSALTLIEGIGGIMVPLDARFTVLDLMQNLGAPVILVAGSALGTISHVLCALDVLKNRDLVPHAIVINESEGSCVAMQDTLETLSHFCGTIPLIAIARQKPGHPPSPSFHDLLKLLPAT